MKKASTTKHSVKLGGFLAILLCTSCSAPQYLEVPDLKYPVLKNVCTFGIQNMDEKAKVEDNSLTCHYNDFDVSYIINDQFVVSMRIVNHSNKSLIIDKSKCYVLYDGYSTQLFKDVRSSRSTTFNNVQDAINNVQTNESGVSMTIPPYSKWELPVLETNIREINQLPQFINNVGIHSLTPYNEQETVEFVIPYTFDYTLADWSTCRNRVFVKSIEVKEAETIKEIYFEEIKQTSNNQYVKIRRNGSPDLSEVNRVDVINWNIYKRHRRKVIASHFFSGFVTFTVAWFLPCFHDVPLVYGAFQYEIDGKKWTTYERAKEALKKRGLI